MFQSYFNAAWASPHKWYSCMMVLCNSKSEFIVIVTHALQKAPAILLQSVSSIRPSGDLRLLKAAWRRSWCIKPSPTSRHPDIRSDSFIPFPVMSRPDLLGSAELRPLLSSCTYDTYVSPEVSCAFIVFMHIGIKLRCTYNMHTSARYFSEFQKFMLYIRYIYICNIQIYI